MSDRFPFDLKLPAKALLIDRIRARLTTEGYDQISELPDGVVKVNQYESNGFEVVEDLRALRLPYDEHNDAKYEADSVTASYRPPVGRKRKPEFDRVMQSDQDGGHVYVPWTAIAAMADPQGKIDLAVLRAKHGPPETIEDWLVVDDHQRRLNNLILRDPAFRCPVERCGLPLLEIPPLPEDGVVVSCTHCETNLVWSSDGPLDGAWAVKEEDEEAAS